MSKEMVEMLPNKIDKVNAEIIRLKFIKYLIN